MQTQFIREGMYQYYVISDMPAESGYEPSDSYENVLLRQEDIPYVMSFEVHVINGSTALYYRLKYRTSLKQAFGYINFDKVIVENIVKSIIGVMETCEEYLLRTENIVFDPESIFMDINTGKLMFCYYPMNENGSTLPGLITEIMQYVDKGNGSAFVFLRQILSCITEEVPDVAGMKSLLSSTTKPAADIVYEYYEDKKDDQKLICDEEEDDPKSIKAEKKKVVTVLKVLMAATTSVCVLLLAGLVCNVLTYEKTGYLFIGMALFIGELILYMHFDPGETADDIMEKFSREMEMRERRDRKFSIYEEEGSDRNVPAHDITEETTLLNADMMNERAITSEDTVERLCLKPIEAAGFEPIFIKSCGVVIGSMPSSCGYVLQTKGISRLHAKITEKPDGLYVVDMNSTNGTYINGDILQSGKEYRLLEGDMISFAKAGFVVVKEGFVKGK